MVVPIMVLLFFRLFKIKIGVKSLKNANFQTIFHYKKKVPCSGKHGTSTYWNTEDYFISSSFIRLTRLSIR